MTSTTESAPVLDELTSSAIRQALASARAERLGDACDVAERALARGGDKIALNALLGMLRMDLGDLDAAVRHLEIAHAGRPSDFRIANNLAFVLASRGEMARVLQVASDVLAFSDPSLQLARLRGFAADQLEDLGEAIRAYEHVVRAAPDDWESLNNLGNARVLTGDVRTGIADLERAAAMAPEAAPTWLNLARAYREAGQLRKAEEILRKMAEDFPEDAKPLIDLHGLLQVQAREDEILEVVDRALVREPANLDLRLARARHFGAILDMQRAEEAFRDVLARDPRNGEAFVGLATVYEHSRPGALDELAQEASDKGAEPDPLNLVRAFADRRSRRFEEAAEALSKVDPDFEGPRRQQLLGQTLEALGKYDEAFAAFERMNDLQTADPSHPLDRAAALRDQLREQLAKTANSWFEQWKGRGVTPSRRSPVFLVGFPRSGTTLLDTILMGHPDTVVMEERPVISRLDLELGGFDAILNMDEPAIRNAQQRYFEIASEYVDVDGAPFLVDKTPLLLNQATFIHRLFPEAHFLLALRHPADVLLSCFVSNFNLNSEMANFLRLDTAAEFYDLTFRTWENARSILPLSVHTVIYERMVEDPSAVLQPIVEALGLEWHEEMLDHTKTAAERGLITTASYAQVTQPIYRRSVGRWQNYRKHLEPILPILAPWAQKFGYTI